MMIMLANYTNDYGSKSEKTHLKENNINWDQQNCRRPTRSSFSALMTISSSFGIDRTNSHISLAVINAKAFEPEGSCLNTRKRKSDGV